MDKERKEEFSDDFFVNKGFFSVLWCLLRQRKGKIVLINNNNRTYFYKF